MAQRCETPELRQPPPGAWLTESPEGVIIGATLRGPLANFFVPFTIFYAIAAPTILIAIGVWSGFDIMIVVGLISAVLCDVPLVIICIFTLFGKQEVRICGVEARVFTGVGHLGLTRHFTPSTIVDVREVMSDIKVNGMPLPAIELVNGESIKLGVFMSPARRRFVLTALQHQIAGAEA